MAVTPLDLVKCNMQVSGQRPRSVSPGTPRAFFGNLVRICGVWLVGKPGRLAVGLRSRFRLRDLDVANLATSCVTMRVDLLPVCIGGINGERSEIAEIEAASTSEAARLRAALRRAPPGAVRQPHQSFERLTQICFDKSRAAILQFRTTT
ncbi:hypothetical protein ZEAMMB73_Zm00001d028632 [Zea mays]|nr:hypothetical protein ZEAMMB73_Zm00001d028632 [Zea mays]